MKKEKKEVRINVRVSEKEYESIKELADSMNLSVSQLMRQAVLDKKKTLFIKSLDSIKVNTVDVTTSIDWLNAKS